MNTGVGLFGNVADVLANYTGSPIGVEANLTEATVDFATLGFCVLGLSSYEDSDGQVRHRAIRLDATGYFRQDGVDHIAKIYRVEKTGSSDYYMLIQSYYDEYMENNLYNMPAFSTGLANSTVSSTGVLTPVELDSIVETENLIERVPYPFSIKPFFLVSEEGDVYPSDSEIKKIMRHVYAMDRKKLMFDMEFQKNVESFILLKNIRLPSKIKEKYKSGTRVDL